MYVRYGCNHKSNLKQKNKSNPIKCKEEICTFQTCRANFKKLQSDVIHGSLHYHVPDAYWLLALLHLRL
jgi:hypothetical protein